MPVNLLPQTPPQARPDAPSASRPDDPGQDAPSFAQSLASATGATNLKPGLAAASGSPGASGADANANAPAAITDEDLVALLTGAPVMPGLPVIAQPLARSPVPTESLAAIRPGREDAADTLSDLAKSLTASAAFIARPATDTAPARDGALLQDVPSRAAPGRVDAELERATALRDSTDTPALQMPETSVKTSATFGIAAEMAARVMQASPEPKLPRTTDPASAAPSAVDMRFATPANPVQSSIQITIATPAFTPAWRDDVAQQLTQLVMLRQDRAEIRLHPADLGPITVEIRMDGGQANLLIQAVQPATRDGLELALPQLRDTLAQQGITLGEASVQDQRQPGDPNSQRAFDGSRREDRMVPVSAPEQVVRARLGLVDLFA
ncbi:MAG: flagellar hook-length control protein FliK [Pseudomonadota bacterium]|nr:flagellar hook-length control protein FliK [Pseudomonadota bacterium]